MIKLQLTVVPLKLKKSKKKLKNIYSVFIEIKFNKSNVFEWKENEINQPVVWLLFFINSEINRSVVWFIILYKFGNGKPCKKKKKKQVSGLNLDMTKARNLTKSFG